MRFTFILLVALLTISCSKEKRSDKAGRKMQDFVIAISDYARGIDSDFIIIPQNGVELAFQDLDPNSATHSSYMAAVNGFGVEELFYNGTYSLDDELLPMLQELIKSKPVMVAEYVSSDSYVDDAIQKNVDEGFITFTRTSTNYDYLLIPDTMFIENGNSINSLVSARNYLYLISTDKYASKSAMLSAINATNFDLVLIDLFFNGAAWSSAEVAQLKTKANGGKRLVIAYMNIGSAESYRYYWEDKWKLHKPKWLKKEYEGYEDEIWVKFWKKDWQDI
ncbi:MAG: endo alpha-1,4 polygalactosaminidase, partial [Flavobacteriales bacterium]|nr:endo alpha-1,4 polygalactosaminidase [Flavobacteriales bacterium]